MSILENCYVFDAFARVFYRKNGRGIQTLFGPSCLLTIVLLVKFTQFSSFINAGSYCGEITRVVTPLGTSMAYRNFTAWSMWM
jgi:hypothetical protein